MGSSNHKAWLQGRILHCIKHRLPLKPANSRLTHSQTVIQTCRPTKPFTRVILTDQNPTPKISHAKSSSSCVGMRYSSGKDKIPMASPGRWSTSCSAFKRKDFLTKIVRGSSSVMYSVHLLPACR